MPDPNETISVPTPPCGLVEPESPHFPDRIGDYRILREIGRGGMGIVYEAEQVALGRRVALKALPATALNDPRRLERFQREAQAAARLHHTNIVPVFGVGAAEGLHFYIMQYIDGEPLDRRIARLRGEEERESNQQPSAMTVAHLRSSSPDGTSTSEKASDGTSTASKGGVTSGAGPGNSTTVFYWKWVARLGIQAAEALAHAHAKGILHRDIKPSNLLLDGQEVLWVTDFGLAKFGEGGDLTQPGDILGTIRYMAPERFEGKGDPRSDVYALGLTLYELLTLRPAFDEKQREKLLKQVAEGEPPPPSRHRSGIPRDLETVVLKAIARDPSRRYAGAAELAEDLRRFEADRPVLARRVGWLEKSWRWARRNPLAASLTSALLLLILAVSTGATIAAFVFRDLAEAETDARHRADDNARKAEANATALADQIERLNRANAALARAQLLETRGDRAAAYAELTKATELRPDSSLVWAERAQFHLRLGLFREAGADLEKSYAIQPPSTPALWHHLACLRLFAGDEAGYRRLCAGMIEHFGKDVDAQTAGWMVEACVLVPNALADSRVLPDLAEKAETGSSAFPYRLAVLIRTAPVPTKELLDESTKQSLVGKRGGRAWWSILLHRAGDAEAARFALRGDDDQQDSVLRSFDLALRNLAAENPNDRTAEGPSGVHWLVEMLLARQAGLSCGEPLAHPLLLVLQARGHGALGRWQEAEAALEAALQMRPEDAHLQLERARLSAAQGQWPAVSTALAQAIASQEHGPQMRVQAADLYFQAERWRDALVHLDAVIAAPTAKTPLPKRPTPPRFPNRIVRLPTPNHHAWALLKRGQCQARLENWEKAATDLFAALKARERENSDLFQQRFRLGNLTSLTSFGSYRLDDLTGTVYPELASRDALYAQACLLAQPEGGTLELLRKERTAFLTRNQRWDEAVAVFKDRIEARLAENKAGGGIGLSASDPLCRELAAWDVVFERVIGQLPEQAPFWTARAAWLARTGEEARAVEAFRRALNQAPAGSETRRDIYRQIVQDDSVFARMAQAPDEDGLLHYERGLHLNSRAHAPGSPPASRKKDLEASEKALETAARARPEDVDLLTTLSLTYTANGKLESALGTQRRLLKLQPDDFQLRRKTGELLVRLEKWPEAAVEFHQAISIAHTRKDGVPQALYEEATARRELFEAVRKLRPEDSQLLLTWVNRHPGPEALSLLKDAARGKVDPRVWLTVARQCSAKQQWEEAAGAFAEALRAESYRSAFVPSPVHAEIARLPDPKLIHRIAESVPSQAPRLWIECANLDLAKGRTDTFEAHYAKALALRPSDLSLRVSRGNIFARLGRWKEAAADFESVAQAGTFSKSSLFAHQHAVFLAAAGRKEDYRRVAERMLALHKDSMSFDAQRVAITCCLFPDIVGDPKTIRLLAERAAQGTSTSSFAVLTLALVECRIGKEKEAADRIRPLLKEPRPNAGPNSLSTLKELVAGLAEGRSGRQDPARKHLRRFLDDLDQMFPGGGPCRLQPHPSDAMTWAICVVLRPEAEAALRGLPEK